MMKKLLLIISFLFFQFTFSQTIVMQDGTFNTCTGTFTDSGGVAGPYANNESFVMTLCSDIPGIGIEVNFLSFNTENINDVLTIYDGPDTASPIIGNFSGFTSPGFVSATGASGCLTFEFNSNIAIFATGWEAEISCCQIITANFDSSIPVADVDNNIVSDVGIPITFNGSGTFSLDATGATYEWDFGDGVTDFGTTVVHSYAANGGYDVTLTITDPSGCTNRNDIGVTALIGVIGNLDAQMAGTSAFAKGSFIEVGISQLGTYGVSNALVPTGYHSSRETTNNLFGYIANPQQDLWIDYDGDYFTPGTPEEGFAIEIDGVNFNNNTTGAQFDIPGMVTDASIVVDPCIGDIAVISWEGTINDIFIERKVILTDTGLFIQMETTLTNIGAVDRNNIFWMHNVDPDNNQTINGNFTTDQEIFEQASGPTDTVSFVCAFQTPQGGIDADGSNVCFYADDERARVTFGGFSNRDASDIWNGIGFTQAEGATNTADEAISVAFNIGTLMPGESENFTYLYVFADFSGTGNFDPSFIRLRPTDPTSCGASDGFIDIQGLIPSTNYEITYDIGGVTIGPITIMSDSDGIITVSGLVAGSYSNFLIENSLGCSYSDDGPYVLVDPGAPIFTVLETDPTTCTADGSIEISGLDPSTTYDVTYTVDGVVVGPVSYTTDAAGVLIILALDQGTYTDITIVLGTCTSVDGGTYILEYPLLSAFTVVVNDPSSCINDGSIEIQGLDPGGVYDVTYTVDGVVVGPVSYTADGTGTIIIVSLDQGVYTDITVEQGPCSITDAGPYNLNYPLVIFTITVTDLTSCSSLDGTITINGLFPNTTFQITYLIDGVTVGPLPYTSDATGEIIISGLGAGTYTDFIIETTPCIGMDIGPYVINMPGVPVVIPPTPYELCDDVISDGFTEFDLTTKDLEISGGDATLIITYHLTLADADAGVGSLVSPYTNITNPQTIFVRVESIISGCYDTTTLELIVLAAPIANLPTPLEICDDNNDGIADFDLTMADAEVIGGQPDTFVTYHLTLADADAAVGALASPYTNVTNPQTVFVRIENSITGCYATTELILIVNPTPVLNDPISDYILCDDVLNDGIEVFDLSSWDTQVIPDPTGLLISYYETAVDASAGTAAIVTPGAYSNLSNPQTIYVRVEDISTGCFSLGEFELIVNGYPIFVDPAPYILCDDGVSDGFTEFDLSTKDAEISAGDVTLVISYHLTMADADADIAPLPSLYTNVTNPQTIYVRVEDSTTGCYGITTLELEVLDAPSAVTPTPLEYCDPDNDGFGEFILTDADAEITGGAIGVVVTYHETFVDATNGVLALSSPYNNIVFGTQIIYARVENPTAGGDCFIIVELTLIVLDTPPIADPEPLSICDDNGDGFAVFDLTLKDPEILNGLDPADYSVEYYVDSGFVTQIVPATAYTNVSNPQIVYVLVTDTANGCSRITELELQVNFAPTLISPTPLELCDVDNPGDEIEPFDLTSKDNEITGGDPTIVITYHETQAEADAGINALSSPYLNIVNPQTVYVRGEFPDTGCFVSDSVTLDLRVNPQPSPNTSPSALEVCDDDNDGFVDNFMLEDRDLEIINGEPDVRVSYHETLVDAELGIFALVSPYANIVADSQIIYVRVENELTRCFTIVELELVVLPSPVIALELEDFVLCDDDDDGVMVFDLTQKDPEVYGSQDPVLFDLTYHETEADAQAGTGAIGVPTAYTNTSNPQTIWVRLQDIATGCYSVGSFELVVSLPPVIALPGDLAALETCDDETADGFTEFDLTQADGAITLGAPGLLVEYYETLLDAQDAINVIDPATAYTNIVNPQTLYVRVSDGDTGCYSLTTLTIRVLPNPSPQVPDPIELCDELTPGDGFEIFDLTEREAQILGGEPGVTPTYHESLEDAQDGINAIVDPTAYTNTENPQTIYVRVTNDITGCYTIVELLLIVNPLPDANVVSDYIICEVDSDGFADFDLTTRRAEALGAMSDLDFTVSFHEVEADAQVGINAIADEPTFTNTTAFLQVIYVRVENNLTGCWITTAFTLEVREGAEATPPIAVYRICDNIGANDGIGQFDLSSQDGEILDGQDPGIYIVTYHLIPADAMTGDNAVATDFVNTENPQTLYVRVTNSDTDCFALTTLTLEVMPLPDIALLETYRLCVDANGNAISQEEGENSPPVLDTGLSDFDYSFVWDLDGNPLPDTTSSIVATQGGVYTVVVTDLTSGLSCMATASTTVTVSSPPLTYSAVVTTLAFADDHQIQAEATGLGVYVFQLDDGPFQDSGLFTGVQAGTHIITIKDANGCGSVTISVSVIDYPLFFTPNQDGYHDTWNIIGIDGTAKIYIFDRFGKLLKQLSPTGEGWDGTYNGNPMPSSDYWFQVIYIEDDIQKEVRGHFTMKR